jgi:NADPH:quinone reductase-like Zn-dependent oxidoreductase
LPFRWPSCKWPSAEYDTQLTTRLRSGYKVIATSSPSNFDLVKGYGADVVVDYKSPSCAAAISHGTSNKLYFVFDIISDSVSAKICADALTNDSTKRPIYSSLELPGKGVFPRADVELQFTWAYTITGEDYVGGGIHIDACVEDHEFGTKFSRTIEKLLEQGRIKAHPIEVRDGGWQEVLSGMNEVKQGKFSGRKLVFRICTDA